MTISPHETELSAMRLSEREVSLPLVRGHRHLLEYFAKAVPQQLGVGDTLTRFVVTSSDAGDYRCELGILNHDPRSNGHRSVLDANAVLRFARRPMQGTGAFNTVLVVPTGVGCEVGGHAGDAGPVAHLLASISDTLITHPNVVNASDIAEIPRNALYVEGSVLSRLMMGTVGLQRIRANRVLVVVDEHRDPFFIDGATNAVSAARSCYGLQCPRVVRLSPPIRMSAQYTPSGRTAGRVEGLDRMQEVLEAYRGEYDAVAIVSVIEVPPQYHLAYFKSGGEMVNPWGGVEAMLTHWLSLAYNVPSAHAPMLESQDVLDIAPGVVDPRIAAEAISTTFMQCILKGLQRSPRIITHEPLMAHPDVLSASDLSCLVIPEGCIGLPTLAALEQGIPVIAVRENRNMTRNDLSSLPWAPGQFFSVANYWEACGVALALKEGLDPSCVRRPLGATPAGQWVTAPGADQNGSMTSGYLSPPKEREKAIPATTLSG
jgi:hypothetical protein